MILRNFIVFEGIDGSGTSTQLGKLREKTADRNVWFTCEPTPLETGIFLRRILKGEFAVHPATAARLFAADRNEHVYGSQGIQERTRAGQLVVCDRYVFSSLAYQSIECGEDLPFALNQDFPLPEILFFFDIDPAISMNRIANREVTEIYERLEFQKKVRKQYLRALESCPDKEMTVVRIDAAESIEKTAEKIWSVIGNLPIMKR